MANEVELERMIVRLIGDGSEYKKMMEDATKSTRMASAKIEEATLNIDKMTSKVSGFAGMVKNYGTTLLAIAGIGGTFETLKKSISLASEAEKNEVAFGTMLKSAEKGKEMVRQLTEFAAATPLNQGDIQIAAKQLLQYGTAGNNVIPTIRMLGDIVGGDAQKLQQLTRAFGQAFSLGRLQGDEMNQMIEAGYNPMADLMAVTGKTEQQILKLREAGKITREMLVQAFQHATAEGGQFHNQMEKQSKTLSGLFSTMEDDISAVLRSIGQDLVDNLNLKDFIQEVSKAAQAFGRWFKNIPAEAKAAAAAVFGVVAALGVLTVAFVILGKIVNVAFGGIPLIVGLVITGIASLVGYLSYLGYKSGTLKENWDKAKVAGATAWEWIQRKAYQAYNYIRPSLLYLKDTAIQAWEWIKTKAIEAWEWIETKGVEIFERLAQAYREFIAYVVPIWRAYVDTLVVYWSYLYENGKIALGYLVDAVYWLWDQIIYIFDSVSEYILGIFQDIAGDSELSWTKIRDYILEVFIMAQFAMENFSKIMSYAWVAAIYQLEVFKNDFLYLFTGVIPAVLNWFGSEWRNILTDVFNFASTVFGNMAKNIGNLAKNIPKLLKGELKFSDLWEGLDKDLTKGFQMKTNNLQIPKRDIGSVEKALKDEFDRVGAALGMSYEEFRRRKMEEYKAAGGVLPAEEVMPEEAVEEVKKQATDLGGETAKSATGAATKELQKFDAVFRNSAEAINRITDFQEKLKMQREGNTATESGGKTGDLPRFEAANINSAEAASRKDPNTGILKDIRDTLKETKSGPKIEPANLEDF